MTMEIQVSGGRLREVIRGRAIGLSTESAKAKCV